MLLLFVVEKSSIRLFLLKDHDLKEKSSDIPDLPSSSEEPVYKPAAPFPQRLRPPQDLAQNSKIFNHFKQVKINIPLLDAIKQVPSYTKFLKDLCTIKHKINVRKKIFLTE